MTNDTPTPNTHHCQQCGNPVQRFPSDLRGKNVFCSTTCSAKFYNKDRIIIKNCLGCDHPYHPVRGSRGMYCSNKCRWHHKKLLIYKAIEEGTYQSLNSNLLRKYLVEKRGEKCEVCGWNKINPTSGKCPIQVDHKDGNAENNHPTNIRLLCGSCHTLTPTYCNLNKGKGRKIRRDRYLKVGAL